MLVYVAQYVVYHSLGALDDLCTPDGSQDMVKYIEGKGARLLKIQLMLINPLTNYNFSLKPAPTPPNIWLLMILVPKMTSQLQIEAEIWLNMIKTRVCGGQKWAWPIISLTNQDIALKPVSAQPNVMFLFIWCPC